MMESLRKLALEHMEEIEKAEKIDKIKLKRYYLISELLKDDSCFFKIPKEDAYQVKQWDIYMKMALIIYVEK